jgi:hypothetical protein
MEQRVVELAVAGATNHEITETLFLTFGAVEKYLASTYRNHPRILVTLRNCGQIFFSTYSARPAVDSPHQPDTTGQKRIGP